MDLTNITVQLSTEKNPSVHKVAWTIVVAEIDVMDFLA
jgi:hypothetical protein